MVGTSFARAGKGLIAATPRRWLDVGVCGTVLALVLAAPPAWARDVSFAQARVAAERGAPDIQLAKGRVDVAAADVEVAGALANPTLGVSTARQTARLGTSIAVPLPIFGQRGTLVRAARADTTAAALDVEVVRREARWRATLAWIDLWEAQESARLLGLAAKDAERMAQIASEKFDAGSGPRLDVLRTKADWARATAEADAAQLDARAAGARLAPWIGAPPDESLTATGVPGYPEAGPPSVANLEARLDGHPAMHRDRAEVTAATLHVRSEERQRWPTVTPQLTVNQFDPTLPGPDVIVGLSFDLPLLNQRGGAIARAEAQRALAEANVAVDERHLHAELLDAYRRTEGANLRLHALREQVLPAMQEARDMTEEGYRSGRIDLIRLLDAQRALLDSRLAEAEAAASWSRAVADLESATGATFVGDGDHAP